MKTVFPRSPKAIRRGEQHNALREQARRLDFAPVLPSMFRRAGEALIRQVSSIDKYEQLAGVLGKHYLRQLTPQEKLHLGNIDTVREGFNVDLRILSYAPVAYFRYSKQTDQPVDLQQLWSILRASHDTPAQFARMSNHKAGTYEIAFGINRATTRPEDPFVISASNSPSQPLLVPNPVIWEDDRLPSPRNPYDGDRCPALGAFTRAVWHQAVDTCVADPRFFAQDLRALSQEQAA